MNKEELEKECLRGMKEWEMAWQEYFKDKPEPKTDEEERKEQEEFCQWYNHVRKQSDTRKTPAEMYKEVYGKEPPQNPLVNSEEPSRIMKFEWDENEEEYELDEAQEEATIIAEEIFENSWRSIKQEIEGASKKEACKYSFILGFLDYSKLMDEKSKEIMKNPKHARKIKEIEGEIKEEEDASS